MSLTRRFRCLNGFLSLLTAAAIAVVIGLGIYVLNACKLRAIKGERVFYLDSQSSQGLRKTELELRDYARITGESVCFARGEESAEELAGEIAEKYSAEILFTEEVAGVISFYCYTPIWDNGILVNGETVNLHVAVAEEECAVGTPIIFDGF
ncbi:MAG: YwmB family TATA-box binding protein [Clostridia bacterium]|nr:YwmB family TATA-box binding protein [Clostridia bacterium]